MTCETSARTPWTTSEPWSSAWTSWGDQSIIIITRIIYLTGSCRLWMNSKQKENNDASVFKHKDFSPAALCHTSADHLINLWEEEHSHSRDVLRGEGDGVSVGSSPSVVPDPAQGVVGVQGDHVEVPRWSQLCFSCRKNKQTNNLIHWNKQRSPEALWWGFSRQSCDPNSSLFPPFSDKLVVLDRLNLADVVFELEQRFVSASTGSSFTSSYTHLLFLSDFNL